MLVPSKVYRPLEDLVIRPREVDATVWQAHVIRHPFGLYSIRGTRRLYGPRRWNHEGWDALHPPTLTEGVRKKLTGAISKLEDGSRHCEETMLSVLETTSAPVLEGDVACYHCGTMLAVACADTTRDVGKRYAAYVDDSLERLQDAVAVDRRALARTVAREVFKDDVQLIGTVGDFTGGAYGLRINRPDGVRVEFRWDREYLEWRTTYRVSVSRPAHRRSHLLAHLSTFDSDELLSDQALVPRPWWEKHQP